MSLNQTINPLSKTITKNIYDKIKKIFIGLLLLLVCGYVIYLVWIQNIDQNSIYGIVALIGITVMILLNILKFIINKESKYLWRIVFYLFIIIFAALLFINQESIQKCLSEDQKTSFLVYTMIIYIHRCLMSMEQVQMHYIRVMGIHQRIVMNIIIINMRFV